MRIAPISTRRGFILRVVARSPLQALSFAIIIVFHITKTRSNVVLIFRPDSSIFFNMMTPLRGNLSNQNGNDQHYINSDGGNDENVLRHYEANGWELGYEVEMNGIGITGFNEHENDDWSDFSDTNDANDDDDDDDDDTVSSLNITDTYVGYQAISLPSMEEVNSGDGHEVMEWSQEQTRQTQNPTDSISEYKPVGIDLDEVKISVIREAMVGINIAPPPQWNSVPNDEQLIDLIKRMTGS